jgi:hypothetical protein
VEPYGNREIARDLDKLISSLDRIVDSPLRLGLPHELVADLRGCLVQISECAAAPRVRLVPADSGLGKSEPVRDEHYAWGP